jgi:hypothetical protein
MNIENISKEKGEVLVRLSKDDLVGICNALYRQTEEQENKENILQLYSDMMMARDLCQYGHIDDFCLQNIVRYRSGIKGVLSDTDIQSFNAYLESNNIPAAFKNSDWVRIYKRIVGDIRCSDILAEWMKE